MMQSLFIASVAGSSIGVGRCFHQLPAPERHLTHAHLSSSIDFSARIVQGTIQHLTAVRRQTVGCQRQRCRANLAVAESGGSGKPAVLKLLSDQFLPIALVAGMTTGLICPGSGVRAAEVGLQNLTTTGIFILSGLGLRRGATMKALTSWGSVAFGMLSILVITPLAAVVALRLPLHPPELAFGLAVFCCMPTTLSSGVSLTQAVGGNTALALLLTVGSNLMGIFTMPFMLCAVLGAGRGAVQIPPAPLLRSLIRTILTPLLLGAAARAFIPGLAQQVDKRKKLLAMLSASLLAMVPWMQISKAVADRVTVQPSALLAAVAAGVGLHLAFLVFNSAAVNALNLGGKDGSEGIRRAVVLVGSQKTLPIAVTVLNQMAAFVDGPLGLAIIPCVVAHLSQVLVDSLLVSNWLRADSEAAASGVASS